jgi:hypothetical protein
MTPEEQSAAIRSNAAVEGHGDSQSPRQLGPAALAVSTNRADCSALSGLGLNLIERTFTEIRVI